MQFLLRLWQLYLTLKAGWMNREQQQVIKYLKAENLVLREQLGKQRILLTEHQRSRLAVKGKQLGRKLLAEVTILFIPDTNLCWHRQLVAHKWDRTARREKQQFGPRIGQEIIDQVLQMAKKIPRRLQPHPGRLEQRQLSRLRVDLINILKAKGLEPAPDRKRTDS